MSKGLSVDIDDFSMVSLNLCTMVNNGFRCVQNYTKITVRIQTLAVVFIVVVLALSLKGSLF